MSSLYPIPHGLATPQGAKRGGSQGKRRPDLSGFHMTVLLQIVCTKNAEFVEINSGLSVSNLLHPRNFTGLKLGKKTS